MPQTVRVLLALSSPLTLKAVERLLSQSPDHGIEIVDVVRRGREVLPLASASHLNLLCLDDAPPALNALEVTKEVMRAHPCPILVLSASADPETKRAFLEAGALDCVPRPDVAVTPTPAAAQRFVAHLKMLSRVPVIGRRPMEEPAPLGAPHKAIQPLTAPLRPTISSSLTPSSTSFPVPNAAEERIVAIGASTGGPLALMTILSALPTDFPLPIVCVQHVSQGFLEGLVSWLDAGCRLRVSVAQAGEKVQAGTVLFPPEDQHMEIGQNGRVRLTSVPARDGHRPSATVLFESVARSYGPRATAVLLTGMGADGASGLCDVRTAGGDTIAQDEASCVVFGMPHVAIEKGGACHVASPPEIVRRLLALA